MYNPESILGNDSHKLLWDFEIQTDHLMSARRPNLIIINKKARTCRIVDFIVTADHVPGPCLGLEKTVEHKSDDYISSNWCSCYSHQRIGTRTGELGNNRTGGDYPNYSIVEIGQNTAKSPGDLRKLAVTETPVKNHQR